ncbi:MAG TPA: hypothetical protein DEH78_27335 [Solibacterales bacterium]|nr:hypothetical protein [Bryobacterales bacterium]
MRTLVAVFQELAEAEHAFQELVDGGVSRESISIVAHGGKCGPAVGPVPALTSATSLGAAAAVGGLGGFTIAMVALAFPGIGPILAAGPIAAELLAGGIGSVAGGVISWLKHMGVPDSDAGSYCEAVRRGGIILSVEVPDERAAAAEQIIGEHRLVDMEASTLEWHRQGWKRFEPGEQPAAQRGAVRYLPFDPESLRPSVRREKAARRAVRSYVRVS